MNIPETVMKMLVCTQRYWRALLHYLNMVRPYMYLKRSQVCKSKSSYIRMHFNDKFCKAVECESFRIPMKGSLSQRQIYILDKKRKCIIVREEVGAILLEEKQTEVAMNAHRQCYSISPSRYKKKNMTYV